MLCMGVRLRQWCASVHMRQVYRYMAELLRQIAATQNSDALQHSVPITAFPYLPTWAHPDLSRAPLRRTGIRLHQRNYSEGHGYGPCTVCIRRRRA